MTSPTFASLGWDDDFAELARVQCDPAASVARVAAVDRDQLLLLDASGAFRARLAGKLLHESVSAAERPCVGDWVCVEKLPGDGIGRVGGVLPRRTGLRRKAPGDARELQMIAANVDVVVVVQSCHYDFNVRRLERYLVMARDGGARPCVLLTKTDLVGPEVVAGQVAAIRGAGISVPVLTLSNVTRAGLGELEALLLPGKTYCFVGSSGVGKSTLINGLIGRDALDAKPVSGTGEGRHTTVRRELIMLANGALVIDNPGMREFGVLSADGGLEASYTDILAHAGECRFRNCTHSSEPGCAVLRSLEAGEIDAEHYENFLKLRKESEYADLSYAEKRRKDKDFGRYVKSVKKDLGAE